MTDYSNNPWMPGMVTDAFIPDQLIAGDLKLSQIRFQLVDRLFIRVAQCWVW